MGAPEFQEARNDYYRNGRDSFLTELGKYGLGRRDLVANVNWFSRVGAAQDGTTRFVGEHSKPGDTVTLRFEMPTLVILHTCPHPLNATADLPAPPPIGPLTGGIGESERRLLQSRAREKRPGFQEQSRLLIGA